MTARAELALLSSDGRKVIFPLIPDTLVRTRAFGSAGERLEFTAHLDDRLHLEAPSTAEFLKALATVSEDLAAVDLLGSVVAASHGEVTVTETLGSGDAPVGATVQVIVDLIHEDAEGVWVTVAGERWEQVASLRSAGPDAAVYAVKLDDDGSFEVRFGDGKRGRRPPTGMVTVRARYRVGGGKRNEG